MSIGTTLTQYVSGVSRICNFFPVGKGIAIAASTSSSAAQFQAAPDTISVTDVMIINTGTIAAFVTLGQTSPTAIIPTPGVPANGICIPGGAIMVINQGQGQANFIAAITASSTTTLYAYQGYGS